MKKIVFYIIILITLVNNSLFAGPKNKFGLSAATELMIPVGSVSTALGGSNLATTSGLDAIYWNPAGLTYLSTKTGEALFSNQIYIADISVNYFAGAYKLPNVGTFGISVKALDFGNIEVTTVNSPDGTGETYSPTYLNIGISYARNMTDRIAFGTTVKVIYNEISRETAKGIAFDFGLQYNVIGSGLQFGVALKNLGPAMTFTGPDLESFYLPTGAPIGTNNEPRTIILQDFELPTAFSLGLSYDFRLDKKNNLMVNGTFQNNSFSTDDYNLGLEYNFNKMLYLRGGYMFTQENTDNDNRIFTGPTFGAGFNYAPTSTLNVAFDYATELQINLMQISISLLSLDSKELQLIRK